MSKRMRLTSAQYNAMQNTAPTGAAPKKEKKKSEAKETEAERFRTTKEDYADKGEMIVKRESDGYTEIYWQRK